MKNTLKRKLAAILAVLSVTAAGSCIPANAAQEVYAAEAVQDIDALKIMPLMGKQIIFNTKYGYLLSKRAYICYDGNLNKVVNILHPGMVYHFSGFYKKGNLILGKYGNGYVILADGNTLYCSLVFRASLSSVPIKSSPSADSKTIAVVNKGNYIYFTELPKLSDTYAYVKQLKGWVNLSLMKHIDNPAQTTQPLFPILKAEE